MKNPTPKEAAELAQIALRVAREAGEFCNQGYRAPKEVIHKGAIDLVTEYDTKGEALIIDRLSKEAPGIPIVGEEGGGEAGELTFYVDPIDGTTNYAHGHPFWCVSIGVLDKTGAPIAGAVVAPALHTEWVASIGSKALRNGEICEVSRAPTIEESLLTTGFPYDRHTSRDNNFAHFIALKKRAHGVRRGGSAALDICFVADGTYEGYWERKLKAWDIAAAAAVLESAGGKITDFDGARLDPRDGNVVVTNGLIHDDLLATLKAVDAELENRC